MDTIRMEFIMGKMYELGLTPEVGSWGIDDVNTICDHYNIKPISKKEYLEICNNF